MLDRNTNPNLTGERKMDKEQTLAATYIMVASTVGKRIECRKRFVNDEWAAIDAPVWNWRDFEYRISLRLTPGELPENRMAKIVQCDHKDYVGRKVCRIGNLLIEPGEGADCWWNINAIASDVLFLCELEQ
jgi:hypothetical protein